MLPDFDVSFVKTFCILFIVSLKLNFLTHIYPISACPSVCIPIGGCICVGCPYWDHMLVIDHVVVGIPTKKLQ